MRILVLSAYHAVSHHYWVDGMVSHFPEHQWTVLTLPARYFSWRIRGNSLTWAFNEQAALSDEYDLLIATSMVDLSTLRGMQPQLAALPTLVYFHENQFAYPMSLHGDKAAVEPQLVNLYTALCADSIVFNSTYNRDTFLAGASQLLHNLPDAVPGKLPTFLSERASVLPVPLLTSELMEAGDKTLANITEDKQRNPRLNIMWNHRWEYDKGPERLLACVQQLPAHLPVTIHIVGQQFRQIPAAMTTLKALLIEREWLGEWGYLAEPEYKRLMNSADIVLSTALHDFQGLAILQGCAAGCTPVVPDRLAYREFIDDEFRFDSFLDDITQEANSAAAKIIALETEWQQRPLHKQSVEQLQWDNLLASYQSVFESTIAKSTAAKF